MERTAILLKRPGEARLFPTVSGCAGWLGVSRQSVASALERKGSCGGWSVERVSRVYVVHGKWRYHVCRKEGDGRYVEMGTYEEVRPWKGRVYDITDRVYV